MDWITTDIAIGNSVEAQDAALLEAGGFRSTLCLDGKPAAVGGAEVERVSVRLEDGPGNDARTFLRAVSELKRLASTKAPVFVHCHSGRSRSAVVVAGFLMLGERLDAEHALERVAQKREIRLSDGLFELLYLLDI